MTWTASSLSSGMDAIVCSRVNSFSFDVFSASASSLILEIAFCFSSLESASEAKFVKLFRA